MSTVLWCNQRLSLLTQVPVLEHSLQRGSRTRVGGRGAARLLQQHRALAYSKSLFVMCSNYLARTVQGSTFAFFLPLSLDSFQPQESAVLHHLHLPSRRPIHLANASRSNMAIQAFTLLLLLTQWAFPAHSQEVAELISFEFSTTLSLALGSPPQKLHLLPTFYTSPSTTLLVPTGAMCLSGSHPPEGDWNPITEPREGSFVGTSSGDDGLVLGGGSQIVRWRASSNVKSLNLTLRRGRGESVRNVSLIESISPPPPIPLPPKNIKYKIK